MALVNTPLSKTPNQISWGVWYYKDQNFEGLTGESDYAVALA